jgi:hypothetical protein
VHWKPTLNEIGQLCVGLLQVTDTDIEAYDDGVVPPPGVYVQVVWLTVSRAPRPSLMTNVKGEVPSLLRTFQYVLTAVCPDGHVMEAMVDVLPAPIEAVRRACELGGDEEQSARQWGHPSINTVSTSSTISRNGKEGLTRISNEGR